jgi:hypothetical protein
MIQTFVQDLLLVSSDLFKVVCHAEKENTTNNTFSFIQHTGKP